MGYKITDKNFMIHVLGNLLEEYESKVEPLEKDLDNTHDPLTIERMTNELNLKYKKICKKNNYDPDEDEIEKREKIKAPHSLLQVTQDLKGDDTHAAILDIRAQIALARKMTQKVTQEKGNST